MGRKGKYCKEVVVGQPCTSHKLKRAEVAFPHYQAPQDFEIFDVAPLPRAAGLWKISFSLHYHAPKGFEIFDVAPLPRAAGLWKFSLSLHYQAPRDFGIFYVAPLPRAAGLRKISLSL